MSAPMSRRARAVVAVLLTAAAGVAAACADLSTDPAVPASIELGPLAFPSVAVGDSLRDTLGVAQPVRAILRNVSGDVIEEAPVRFLSRNEALLADSLTGHVFAVSRPAANPVALAARFENALQIQAQLRITNAPDTAFRTDSASLVAFLPEAAIGSADSNSVAVEVRLQYRDSTTGTLANSSDWLVRFAVVSPANLRNDTTAAVFLVNDRGRASQVDTSSGNGLASRRVRVRPTQFPASGVARDTVEVEAAVGRRGVLVGGRAVRIRVPVAAASTRGSGGS
jgi:hypothetical protein